MWDKKIVSGLCAFAFLMILSGTAFAGFEVEARGGFFEPSDTLFKGFYDHGPVYGLYAGWTNSKGLGALVGSDLYMKSFTYNGRKHNAKLYPITASLIYMPLQNTVATPVFGAGWGYYLLDDISLFSGNKSSNSAIGYHMLAGVRFRIFKGLFADLDLKYSFSRLQSVNDMNVGGWTSTGGIGYEF